MITNKHISKIIIGLMAVAVILCILAIGFSDKLTEAFGGTGINMEYETALFDTSEIISIDIQMSEDNWNSMLANATSEEYYVCDVVVNGKKITNVAIRPKGNTSLSAIAMDPDSNRFSLKLEFDRYVENQTCYGLDKLILNNNYADATNMKEAVIYDMYQYLGADASLYNYANVSVNGEYWGVYLALEAVEDSFMLRNYGTQDGELYKPETLGMGGGDSKSSNSKSDSRSDSKNDSKNDNKSDGKSDSNNSPAGGFSMPGNMPSGGFDGSNMPSGGFDGSNMPSGGFDGSNVPSGDFDFSNMGNFDFSAVGGSKSNSGGADLNYVDDKLDSYSTIWEGSVTDTTDSDHRKVVTALENIHAGTNLEDYLDIDNILKYMAVHVFSVNMDSLSANMAHNYYLYEYDGKLNIIPWDYNLSLGGMAMGSSDASSMINDAIDTPFAGTDFFNSLLENEEYLAKYHEYLQMLVDEYVEGGRFDELYTRIRNQIDSLVETDPTAFYSYDEYLTAANMLYKTITLRAQSIEGQINGTIPSTDAGQRNSKALIDASEIDIACMGQFNMGGMFGNSSSDSDSSDSSMFGGFDKSNFDFSNMGGMKPGNMDFSNMGGMKPDNMDFSNMDFSNTDFSSMGGMNFGAGTSFPGMGNATSKIKGIATLILCFVAMIIALVVVKHCRRKRL